MASHVTGNDLSTVGPSAAHGCAVTGEGCQNLVGFQAPCLDSVVRGSRCSKIPVGTNCDTIDGARMTSERTNFVPCFEIPQLEHAI